MPSPSTPGDEVHARADHVERPDDGERQTRRAGPAPRSPVPAAAWRRRRSSAPCARARATAPSRPRSSRASAGHRRRPARPCRRPRRWKSAPASAAFGAQLHQRNEIGVVGVDHVERPLVVQRRIADRGQRHAPRRSDRPRPATARAHRCWPPAALTPASPRSSLLRSSRPPRPRRQNAGARPGPGASRGSRPHPGPRTRTAGWCRRRHRRRSGRRANFGCAVASSSRLGSSSPWLLAWRWP